MLMELSLSHLADFPQGGLCTAGYHHGDNECRSLPLLYSRATSESTPHTAFHQNCPRHTMYKDYKKDETLDTTQNVTQSDRALGTSLAAGG